MILPFYYELTYTLDIDIKIFTEHEKINWLTLYYFILLETKVAQSVS